MSLNTENMQNTIELELPLKDGSPGYLGLFFRYYSTLGMIASDSKGESDYRIMTLTSIMISAITDKNVRTHLKGLRKQLIDDGIKDFEKTNTRKLSVEEKNKIVVEACYEILGEISDFMDEYLGVTTKMEVCLE